MLTSFFKILFWNNSVQQLLLLAGENYQIPIVLHSCTFGRLLSANFKWRLDFLAGLNKLAKLGRPARLHFGKNSIVLKY